MLDRNPERIPDTYRTSDFKQAAYLKAKRVEHVASEREPNGRVTFVFADRERCDELVGEVYCASVFISLPDLWAAEHALRLVINAGQPKREFSRE